MIVTRTPFRISFFGGGTDYPAWFHEHGGAVLSATIDKYCYLSVRNLPPFFEHKHRIVYSVVEMENDVNAIKHPVVREVLKERSRDEGLEIHHDGDLPARSGLGSSSSFAVGFSHALAALDGKMVSKAFLAKEAIRIEQDILNETVGCQDQISAAFGGFNRIDFLQDGNFNITPMISKRDRIKSLEKSLMLFFTGQTRQASKIASEVVSNFRDKEQQLMTMRSMVDQAEEMLGASDDVVRDFGELLRESWQLKRGLAGSVSNDRIDEIFQAGHDAGAYGGKLLGAGGGGFVLFVVPEAARESVLNRLKNLVHVKFNFETGGSKVIVYNGDGKI